MFVPPKCNPFWIVGYIFFITRKLCLPTSYCRQSLVRTHTLWKQDHFHWFKNITGSRKTDSYQQDQWWFSMIRNFYYATSFHIFICNKFFNIGPERAAIIINSMTVAAEYFFFSLTGISVGSKPVFNAVATSDGCFRDWLSKIY